MINGKSYFFKPSTSNTRNGQMVKNEMFVYKKKHILQTLKVYFARADGRRLMETGITSRI